MFANNKGGPLNRRNLLRRQVKVTAEELKLPAAIDFRSFRTIHASLMSRTGAQPEVVRDNMGHGSGLDAERLYQDLVGRTRHGS